MFAVALLVIPCVLLDASSIGEPWHTVGAVLNWVTWGAFAIELAVMLAVAPNRAQYLRQNPVETIIVFLTPPFMPALLNSLRALRLLRVLRLLRLAPVVRWMFSGEGVRYAALFVFLVALAAGGAWSVLDSTSYGQGVYWAVTTMTTLGDPHLVPNTSEEKALAVLVMLVGVGFFATITGSLAERFVQGPVEEVEAVEQVLISDDRELLAKVEALSAQVEELREALERRAA